MREIWVRILAVLTGLVVVLLALAFAWLQNPREMAVPEARTLPAEIEAGRAIYQAQNCSMCHAIAGEGNPRSPLDNAGTHYNAAQLHDWIIAAGAAEEALPARAIRGKQSYRELTDEELNALITYLQWVARNH